MSHHSITPSHHLSIPQSLHSSITQPSTPLSSFITPTLLLPPGFCKGTNKNSSVTPGAYNCNTRVQQQGAIYTVT
uniref:Uncharacterized protein n=1 Tax=Anguilla anguilla TaxID=7936 RepID=A0A0E9S072_ANGAN